MTRETRIGLLVGLGFIIMFGLVLTELTGSAKPGPLPSSLRENTALAMAPIEEVSPSVIDHTQTVPRLGQPVVSPPVPSPIVSLAASTDTSAAMAQPATQAAQGQPEIVAVIGDGGLQRAADQLAPAGVVSADYIAAVIDGQPAAPQQPAARTYVVQSKDSLIKIAVKVYGKGHEADYKRIFEANKSLLRSPSAISAGQKLVIPPLEAAPAAPPAAGSGEQVDLAQLPARLAGPSASAPSPSAPTASATAGGTYTIQRGDTLTKIARKTLNDGSTAAVRRIIAANKDKLPNPNRLPVGLKLVIPG